MKPTKALRHLTVRGLHGRQTLRLQLSPTLNIVHGNNGSGKTTCLHIIANLIDGDIPRFCHLRFDAIEASTYGGTLIELVQKRSEQGTSVSLKIDGHIVASDITTSFPPTQLAAIRLMLRDRLGGRPVYLPAFRSVFEAISRRTIDFSPLRATENAQREHDMIAHRELSEDAGAQQTAESYGRRERARGVASKTVLCREWFGEFVPVIRLPSLNEISGELQDEARAAEISMAIKDQETLSAVFTQVLDRLMSPHVSDASDNASGRFERIRKLLTAYAGESAQQSSDFSRVAQLFSSAASTLKSSDTVSQILSVYEQALSTRAEYKERTYQQLRRFEASVNRFLENKRLSIEHDGSARGHRRARIVVLADGSSARLNVLSSGERHILSLIFAATHMRSGDGIVLVDEPELSLHVDWQRIVLTEMINQAGSRQLIACTHAPEISAEHRSQLVRLESSAAPSSSTVEGEDELDDVELQSQP